MSNKATLVALFQQGDIPTGANYADLINSNVNMVDTATQSMAGALAVTELITPRVSATNFVVNGTFQTVGTNISLGASNNAVVSAGNTFSVSAVTVDLNASTGITVKGGELATGSILSLANNADLTSKAGNVTVSAGNNVSISSQNSVNITPGAAGNINLSSRVLYGVGIVSAAGTTQGAAASLTNIINRGKGIVDGSTTGFTPLANRAGMVQYLYNEGASANLWPPTGGTINGLAANAVFPLAASAMVTIIHLTASAYAVK